MLTNLLVTVLVITQYNQNRSYQVTIKMSISKIADADSPVKVFKNDQSLTGIALFILLLLHDITLLVSMVSYY